MKGKNIITYVFDKIGNDELCSFVRSLLFFFALLPLVMNLSCGNADRDKLKFKTNSPPVITSVTISPNKPNKESELILFIQSHDPDGDSVTFHYQWMKNDEEILRENSSPLKDGNFKKGDLIRIKVTPSDGKMNGKSFLSDPVKILNSSPMIQEVRIEPKVAYANDNLKVSVRSSDLDGDFVYYTYQWEKNGVILSEERKEILERGQFKRGDSITITVTPDDRDVISNCPPIIISSPPTSVAGTTYVYQVKANHPDEDPVFFILKSGPKEMEIDKNTGLIRWEIHQEDKGSHLIEIEACDNEGGRGIQRYTLAVEFK
jgi:hypothetical protein